ncbi:MAG: FHA domain-containing protein, partial [Rhodospirillales bacterium]|nr:FHA domain-containing protein [Rhodospirillales bacterium]
AAALPALARELAAAAAAPGAAAQLRHELVVVMPGAPPRRVAIPASGLTIGRLPPCELLLPGSEVSRQHCRLELREGAALLTDLNSTNGTLVDGSRVVGSVPLAPGATLQVGVCRLTYERRAVAVEPPPEAAGERTLRVRLV